MWLIKVFSAICFFAVCAAQDSQNVTVSVDISTITVSTPLVLPTTYAPPTPFLQLQTKWPDVFLSEKVEFKCNIAGDSDWAFTWLRNGEEVQDLDPNVSFSEGRSVLTLTAATQSAGIYTCKVHHKTKGGATESTNSQELKVHSKPKPTVSRSSNFDTMFPGESITFECTVAISSGWDFLWYHNGEEIRAPSRSHTYTIERIDHPNSGEYHCRAKRGKDPFYTEDSSKTTLWVSDPPTPHLRLLSPWADVFENETLQFVCEVNSPMWIFTWYKDRVELKDTIDEEEQFMNITSVTQTEQGDYACKVHLESRNVSSGFSNTVEVTVYDRIPKATLSKDPELNPMYVGEIVTFTCNVDVSWGWEYEWWKDGTPILETNKTISIHLSSSNKGIYSCLATRGENTLSTVSERIAQDVLEIPVPSLKLLTRWSDVFPAETVAMKCEMDDSSDWTFTWYNDGLMVQADNVVSFDANEASLSINSASAAHAGTYRCMGHLNKRSVSSSHSSEHNLTVYEKQPTVTLTQDPDYKVMFPGESVSLSCHTNVSSGWEYVWFKDNTKLGVSGNRTTFILRAAHQGSYKCKLQRSTYQVPVFSQALYLTVKEKSPKPLVTQQPDVSKVYTSELVTFTCSVEGSTGWKYFWEKDGTHLSNNSNSFNIPSASLLDNGAYKCKALRDKTKHWTEPSDGQILHISEIPVPSLERLTPWFDVFPGESVTWSCGMDGNPDWTYTWYKDGQRVQTDKGTFNSDASTYDIRDASSLHHGRYTCSAKLKGRSVNSNHSAEKTLHVYGTKPSIKLIQNPDHNVMHTGDALSFDCRINVSSGWEFLWYKDGSPFKESRNNHTILSVLTKDRGLYTCQTKRGTKTVFYSDESVAVRLNIDERPKADVVLLTGWSEVFSTDSLVLECGVQGDHPWNYTWYRDSQPIALVDIQSKRYTVTPQNDPEQRQYSCRGISNERPSYSEMSKQFETKNLLLKRRVLLSISGIIFFGIIFTFIGCIFLRIFRKPADDEYKPEEADLFVRMTQLKDSDEAVCPVAYVGQDAFSKQEGDANGTICSETTPLPITLQSDQELTTEINDATETNGGLISFKQ